MVKKRKRTQSEYRSRRRDRLSTQFGADVELTDGESLPVALRPGTLGFRPFTFDS